MNIRIISIITDGISTIKELKSSYLKKMDNTTLKFYSTLEVPASAKIMNKRSNKVSKKKSRKITMIIQKSQFMLIKTE
jgi:23S rRNA pseudoU1915 N3-methylase RlmH